MLYANYLNQQRDELNVFKLTSTSWWTVPKAQKPTIEPPDEDLSTLYELLFRCMRLRGDAWESARSLAHGMAWMLTSASTELRQHLAEMGLVAGAAALSSHSFVRSFVDRLILEYPVHDGA